MRMNVIKRDDELSTSVFNGAGGGRRPDELG